MDRENSPIIHQMVNRIQVRVESLHIKKMFARIADIGRRGTKGTMKGSFVLKTVLKPIGEVKLTC